MRRIVLLLVLAAGMPLDAMAQGSLVVRGEFLTNAGCLAFLNDARVLKKTGLCSFAVIAPGVKVADLACNSTGVGDTILNCIYSPIKRLSGTYNPAPSQPEGTMLLPIGDINTSNGCFSLLNHQALRCGFNIVLMGVAIPEITFTTVVRGGDTWLEASYAPVRP